MVVFDLDNTTIVVVILNCEGAPKAEKSLGVEL
jgi:hypothetical protein